jgi:hypothetical protein
MLRRLRRHFHPQTAGDCFSGYDILTDGAVPERIVRKAPTEHRAIESVRRNDGATPQILVTDDRATAWDGAPNLGTAQPPCPRRAGGGQYENACEQRGKNEADCRARASRSNDGMIKTPTGKSQTGGDVLDFQVRQLFKHLLRGQARCEQVQHVRHPDAQPAHTGTASALVRVHGDPTGKGGQSPLLGHRIHRDPARCISRRSATSRNSPPTACRSRPPSELA